MVVVEGCLECWASTDIPSSIETPKPFVGFRLHYRNITECFFNRSVTFRSLLSSLKHNLMQILRSFASVISKCRYGRKTTRRWPHKNAHTKHTRSHRWRPLGRLVHKANRYLEAYKRTTSGISAAFKFQEFLCSISHTRLGSFRFPCFRFCYFGFRPH
jgi:hypothetical protein